MRRGGWAKEGQGVLEETAALDYDLTFLRQARFLITHSPEIPQSNFVKVLQQMLEIR